MNKTLETIHYFAYMHELCMLKQIKRMEERVRHGKMGDGKMQKMGKYH